MSWDIYGAQRIDEGDIAEKFAAEEKVAQYVADLTGNTLVSFPRYSVVDRLLVMDGLASGFLEVKTRTTPRKAYPTYRISTEKLLELRVLAEQTKVTTLIVVEWACGSIGSMNVLDEMWHIQGTSAELPMSRIRPLKRGDV